MLKFEWDLRKDLTNRLKHGISFADAVLVFSDPDAMTAQDTKHSLTESRYWHVGESDQGVLVVVFTERYLGKVIRIISARRANRRERVMYEQNKRIPL